MPAYGYEFYLLVVSSISHSFAALTREISSWPLEDKIHIHARACNILYICTVDLIIPPFSLSENDCFLCIVTFVLVYYFSMVGAVWFVILAFSWSICFKTLGSTRDNFAGKIIYFHIIAWTYPLTLAISVLALKQVIWKSLNPWTY